MHDWAAPHLVLPINSFNLQSTALYHYISRLAAKPRVIPSRRYCLGIRFNDKFGINRRRSGRLVDNPKPRSWTNDHIPNSPFANLTTRWGKSESARSLVYNNSSRKFYYKCMNLVQIYASQKTNRYSLKIPRTEPLKWLWF